MKFFIGAIVVIGCTLTGYYLHGGNIMVLYQPTEYLIIGGAAVGSFIIANTGHSIKGCLKGIKTCLKGGLPYTKAQYLELLKFQYEIFKFMKTKGMLEIESHIENPDKSDLFSKYPSILSNHHALDFICDYIRVMTMGVDDKYQLEDMMDKELEVHHHEKHVISHAVVTIGDALPAIGIVAAVLGVIITMGSIAEPPEILGGLVGAALVGTFLGIFLCYGLVGPMGQYLDKYFSEEHQYFDCIKTGLLCHLQGNAPAVSAEFARKVIPDVVKPSFKELEEAMQEVK
jgi:chemotaxis protein MotA